MPFSLFTFNHYILNLTFMKTKKIVITAFLMLAYSGFAQLGLTYDWTKTTASNFGFSTSTSFADADNSGNIFTSGAFDGTVDFNPGSGVYNITATGNKDGFLQKLDPNGVFIWAVNWHSTGNYFTSDIEMTSSGEVVIAGYFSGTIDCDPGPGVVSYTSAGINNPVLMKFDTNGNLLWSKHIACTSNSYRPGVYVNPINNDVFIHGFFTSALQPDQTNAGLTYTSAGGWDGFAVQFSAGGLYVNGFHINGPGTDIVNDVIADNLGNLLLIGGFAGTVDFDPSPATSALTATLLDGFVAKYNSTGQFIQTIQFEGSGYNPLTKIKKLNSNDWIITGSLDNGTVDLDPGAGISTFNNSDVKAIFYTELDASFNFTSGGGLSGGENILVDLFQAGNGRVYLNGHFKNTVDFNPGVGVDNLTSSNGASTYDEFTLLLNSNLTYNTSLLSNLVSSNPSDWGSISFRRKNEKVIKSGAFYNTTDFDPSPAVDNHSLIGPIDYYTSLLSLCTTPVFSSISETSCGNYTSPSGLIYTSTGSYIDTVFSSQGCDSIITINLTVNQPALPTASVIATSDSICQGASVTFSANLTNEGTTPSFQWFLNGTQVSTSSSFGSFTLANNDEVYLVMTSNASCISTTTATSDTITMVVGNPGSVSTISISTSSTSICEGDQVTYTSTISNGGNYPSYYWEINGLAVGSNNDQLTVSNLADNDEVFCSLISSDGCLLTTQSGSNIITMTVYPVATPEVTITGPSIICAGENAIFSSTSSGAGSSPVYNWYVNSNTTAIGSGPNLTTNSLNNEDTLICVIINNDPCATVNYDVSNSIVVTVQSNVVPTIAMSSSSSTICEGEMVDFSNVVTGEGSIPGYQWKLNGSNIAGAVNPIYSSNTLSDQDEVSCVLFSSLSCASVSTVTSNVIQMTVNPMPISTVTQNGLQLTADETGASYQWIDCGNGNAPIANATNQSYNVTVNGQYAVVVSNGNCSDTSSCIVINTVGVDELTPFSTQIFPNPVNEMYSINSSMPISRVLTVDLSGKLVQMNEVENSAHVNINSSNLNSGFYLLRIEFSNGMSKTERIEKR